MKIEPPIPNTVLPCPFCGGEPWVNEKQYACPRWWAGCGHCHFEIWPHDSRQAVIAAWNTRHNATPDLDGQLGAAVKTLETACDNETSIGYEAGIPAAAPGVCSEIPVVKESLTPDPAEAFRVINALWMLLDDIDTLDDAAKDDDAGFRQTCYAIQQKRWQIYNIEDPGSICKTPSKPVFGALARGAAAVKQIFDLASAPPDSGFTPEDVAKAVLDAAGVKYAS